MNDPVHLSAPALASLREAAAGAFPAECCGLLAGRGARVEAIYPVANVAERREASYEMAPAEMWAARRRAAASGLDVLGFYHSHPRTTPVPSSYDIERAYYPDAVYLIVGPPPRFDARAFRIAGGRADEIEVVRDA